MAFRYCIDCGDVLKGAENDAGFCAGCAAKMENDWRILDGGDEISLNEWDVLSADEVV